MTQVKDKTDQQLNRALAELMGYSVVKYRMPPDPDRSNWSFDYYKLVNCEGIPVETGLETEEEAWAEAPDYCTDPAASLEVEKKAIEVDYKAYLKNMQKLRWNRSSSRLSLWDAANLMLASPRERAEAAYITLQGALTSSKEE